MPGMPLSGQTWPVAAGSFVASWMVMMVPMMLPSLVPVLWRWTRSGHAMALVGVAYYLVWAAYGLLAYALTIGVTAAEVRWPALASFAPAATGVVLLLAGGLQLTAWKVRQLASCWDAVSCGATAPARSPWRQGLRLGVHCGLCCSGYMIVLLVTGMMQLGLMVVVAAAIEIERLAPTPRRFARVAGALIILTGAVLLISPE